MDIQLRRKEYWIVSCVAVVLFLICLSEIQYIQYLRHKHQQLEPADWSQLTFNGSTNLLVPWIIGEQELYAAKVNQIRLHGIPCDPFIQENRSFKHWIPDAAQFYIIALLSLPFSNMADAWTYVSYFLFAVWFIFLYIFFRKIFKFEFIHPWLYVLAALIPICFGDFFRALEVDFSVPNPGKWLWQLFNIGFYKRGVEFLRMSSPLLTCLIIEIWLAVVVLYILSKKNNRLKSILIGIAGGSLALIHFYEWSYAMAGVGCLWLIVLWRKEFFEYRRNLTWIIAPAFFSSLFFLWILTHGVDGSVILRAALAPSRKLNITALFPLLIGVLSLRRSFVREEHASKIFWSLMGGSLIAGSILLNQQVLSGFVMDNWIYHRLTSITLSLVVSGFLIEYSAVAKKLKWNACACSIFILFLTFFNTKSFAEKHYRVCGLPQTWEDGFHWLNQNTVQDTKVLTISSNVLRLLPAYTHVKQHVANSFPLSSKIATDENLRRTGAMFKTLSINAPKFFKERWGGPTQETHNKIKILSKVDLKDYDCLWNNVLAHAAAPFIKDTLPPKVIEYQQTEPALTGDFYVWVNQEDKDLFLQPMELRNDFNLVYKNNGVEIYRSK